MGGVALVVLLPGALREIADAMERRSAPPQEDRTGGSGFRCASCGVVWSSYHADCPDCGALMDEQ